MTAISETTLTVPSWPGVGVRIFPPGNPFPPEEIYGSYEDRLKIDRLRSGTLRQFAQWSF